MWNKNQRNCSKMYHAIKVKQMKLHVVFCCVLLCSMVSQAIRLDVGVTYQESLSNQPSNNSSLPHHVLNLQNQQTAIVALDPRTHVTWRNISETPNQVYLEATIVKDEELVGVASKIIQFRALPGRGRRVLETLSINRNQGIFSQNYVLTISALRDADQNQHELHPERIIRGSNGEPDLIEE